MLRLDLNLVYTIVNLIILYLLMARFLFKPVKAIIAKRQEEADQAFAEAEKKKGEALEAKTQYETSVKEIEGTKAAAVSEAKKTAAVEYQKIVDEASNKAKTIVEDAKLLAEHEKKQILKSAETEITEMVIDAAAKVAGVKASADSDKALYDQFIKHAE